jgi:hypothetical protein
MRRNWFAIFKLTIIEFKLFTINISNNKVINYSLLVPRPSLLRQEMSIHFAESYSTNNPPHTPLAKNLEPDNTLSLMFSLLTNRSACQYPLSSAVRPMINTILEPSQRVVWEWFRSSIRKPIQVEREEILPQYSNRPIPKWDETEVAFL